MLRRTTLVLIVAIGLAAIGILLIGRQPYARQHIKACFDDVQGLRSDATVRLAGVDIGTVRRVQANPQRKDCPAQVEMEVTTSYEIKIPKDSLAEVSIAGVLGETYVKIDTTAASGPQIENYGYLNTKPSEPAASLEDYLKALDRMVESLKTLREAQKEACGQGSPPSTPQPHGKGKSPAVQPPPK